MRRMLLYVAMAAVLLTLSAGPAQAQYPPGPSTDAGVSSGSVAAGDTVVASGGGWQPGSQVTISSPTASGIVGTASVGADGSFSGEIAIPGVPPGVHLVHVTGIRADGQPHTIEMQLEVVAPGAVGGPAEAQPEVGEPGAVGGPATAGELAVTGGNITAGTVLAAVLLLAGGIAVLVTRRRRRRLVPEG